MVAAFFPIFAHTTFPGGGNFLNGAVHPFTVPYHILLFLVTGLLITQPRPLRLDLYLPALALGIFLGLVGCLFLPVCPTWPLVLSTITLVISLCVAARVELPVGSRFLVMGLSGAALGYDSAPDLPGWLANVEALLGTGLALFIVIMNIACYLSLRPQQFWAEIGLRVVAAWIAAISLMMLAFHLRGMV